MEIAAPDFCRYYWDLLEDRSDNSNKTKLEEQYEVMSVKFHYYGCSEKAFHPSRAHIARPKLPYFSTYNTHSRIIHTQILGSDQMEKVCIIRSSFLSFVLWCKDSVDTSKNWHFSSVIFSNWRLHSVKLTPRCKHTTLSGWIEKPRSTQIHCIYPNPPISGPFKGI